MSRVFLRWDEGQLVHQFTNNTVTLIVVGNDGVDDVAYEEVRLSKGDLAFLLNAWQKEDEYRALAEAQADRIGRTMNGGDA